MKRYQSLSILIAIFPDGPGLTGTRMSSFRILVEVRITEVAMANNWSYKPCKAKAVVKLSPRCDLGLEVSCLESVSRPIKTSALVSSQTDWQMPRSQNRGSWSCYLSRTIRPRAHPVVTINKPALSLYRPDALPVTQPTVLKHWREKNNIEWTKTIIIQFCRCWTVTEGVNYWTKTASDGLTWQFAAEVRKLQQMFKVDVVMTDNKAAVWHCHCHRRVVTSIWLTMLMTCLYLLVVLPRHVARTTQQHLQPLKLSRHLSCR